YLQLQRARGPAQGRRATDLRRQRGDRGSQDRGGCRRQARGRRGLQPHRTLYLQQGSEAKAGGTDAGRFRQQSYRAWGMVKSMPKPRRLIGLGLALGLAALPAAASDLRDLFFGDAL